MPDPLPRCVEGLHQRQNRCFVKTAGKISAGGWIGNASCAQPVEKRFVIAAQLDVFESLTPQQGVGQVQPVIAFVVGQVPFEQVQPSIDFLGSAQFLAHEV